MSNPANAKVVLDVLKDNYKEVLDIGKRTGDRMTILMGITATGFGLLIKVSENGGCGVSWWLLWLSVFGLLSCFGIAVFALFPRPAEQPGSTDLNFLWDNYVNLNEEQTLANVMNDLSDCLRKRREASATLSWWFRVQICVSAATLISAAASELLSLSK